MNKDTNQVLEKVKKLFALANNKAASEGEVINALQKARKLMAEYHLSEKQLDSEESKVVDTPFDTDTKTPSSNLSILAGALAKYFRCRLYKTSTQLHILGLKEDVDLFYESLRLAYSAFKNLSSQYVSNLSGRSVKLKAKNSYLLGFCKGAREALEDYDNKYALVLQVPKSVDDYVHSMNLESAKIHKKQDNSSLEHYNKGFKDGKDVLSKRYLSA